MKRAYIAIDLKSFYASVECVMRGLDPLTTNLVVADESRTEKTICLAVSPSLKAFGIPGRPRLFEVVQKVAQVNAQRKRAAGGKVSGTSVRGPELMADPSLAVDYLVAAPRMRTYMEWSTRIFQIYLRYIAPEDIHVYSVDEVFIDATAYLNTYQMSAHELCRKMIRDVLSETGVTATGGIGTNLYLSKIAMDIMAKHMDEDADGVRIAQLDEQSYRRYLWTHRPLTDFWRVGRGIARKLESKGIFTMGDVARLSLESEDTLYELFGVNAANLIDHAWGYDDVTLEAIKSYVPENNSISSGQVLQSPYPWKQARLIVREMTDLLVLDLVEKGLVADQMVLTVGYDIENLQDPERRRRYQGEVVTDRYGRQTPKAAHGSIHLDGYTSSGRKIMDAVSRLYDEIVDPSLLVRRMYVVANHVIREQDVPKKRETYRQMDLFTDYAALQKQQEAEEKALERERRAQQAILEIRKKYGKNAILRGMNLEEGATARDRNRQVGGHRG